MDQMVLIPYFLRPHRLEAVVEQQVTVMLQILKAHREDQAVAVDHEAMLERHSAAEQEAQGHQVKEMLVEAEHPIM